LKVLLTGGRGMLGRTLVQRLSRHELVVTDLPELDITSPGKTRRAFSEIKPSVVIHCAAMTAVDQCEVESDLAFRVNAVGTANVAIATERVGARLIAVSTDYVFDGSASRPYHEWDKPDPRTAYGASKLAGEQSIAQHCPDHAILRTAWLYGTLGPSFLHTMMKLGSTDGPPLKIVADQVGNPTSTDALASCIAWMLDEPAVGIVHATCEGEASWYDFAQAIFELWPARRDRLPCTTAEYPRPAPRPANSRLEKRALRLLNLGPMPHWRDALGRFFSDHPTG